MSISSIVLLAAFKMSLFGASILELSFFVSVRCEIGALVEYRANPCIRKNLLHQWRPATVYLSTRLLRCSIPCICVEGYAGRTCSYTDCGCANGGSCISDPRKTTSMNMN